MLNRERQHRIVNYLRKDDETVQCVQVSDKGEVFSIHPGNRTKYQGMLGTIESLMHEFHASAAA